MEDWKRPTREQMQKTFDYEKNPGRTKQADAQGQNLTTIVDKWRKSGQTPVQARQERLAVYGDFTNVGDYMEMTGKILAAQQAFDELPARVRDHFQNDPQELVNAWGDPDRQQELIDLEVRPKPASLEVEPDPEPTPDPAPIIGGE